MAKEVLKGRKEILNAFRTIKFKAMDLDETFEERYVGYKWYIIPHWRVTQVVYAVPANNQLDKLPWESWYLDDSVETHHVHYAYKIHENDIEWIQKEWTEERPDEIVGRYWYWYDDKNMKPVLLQQSCREKEEQG